MAVLGLRFYARAFSSCGERGPLFIAVRGPLTVAASLVAEHRLQTHRLSNCGSRAQSLRGMWDPPRPGREPVSPALAGRLPTTAPPGKPNQSYSWNPSTTWLQGYLTGWLASYFCFTERSARGRKRWRRPYQKSERWSACVLRPLVSIYTYDLEETYPGHGSQCHL